MVSSLDALPTTREYLATLPEGLDSYPEAQARGSMARAVLDYQPEGLDPTRLPDELRWMLEHPPTANQWIPEARVLALMHAVRDLAFDTDEDFFEWVRSSLHDLFATPVYRLLMAMASPQMLARQADRAWARVRRGTVRQLEERGDNHNLGTLRYPPHLFDRFSMGIVCAGVEVTYRMSRARAPEVRMLEWTPTYARIMVVYDVSLESNAEESATGTDDAIS